MFKVSVIVPIYGVEAYIERCVRALFSQTLTDIEYIFVDDCTPDSSVAILKHLEEEYSDRLIKDNKVVKLYRMSENSGLPAVRKFAIQQATGDYIIHCDSDDWVDAKMYEELYNTAKVSGTDIVICDFYQTDSIINKYIKACNSTNVHDFIYDCLCGRSYWSMWNKLIRRSLYEYVEVYPKDNMGEDMVICMQLLWNSSSIAYVNKPLYYYYMNDFSIVRSKSKDKILSRFNQAITNTKLLEGILRNKHIGIKYSFAFDLLKMRQLNILSPLIECKEIYKLWVSTFPELFLRNVINPYMPLKNKLKYYLKVLRII